MEDPLSQKKPRRKPDNRLLFRYAGLAFQMMATLGLAVFIGYKLDQWTGWSFPVFMIILSLLALVLILWQIIKDTRRNE
ncbi:AtpZ/AtpI family protein [Chitinophaga tropicalis]|uniref:ATPase F0F1 n=1 Tax=Chitinophaga tropicalis TaxID=2683588 RepID=A0A7K1UB65_9BACT|nr:ATPase F0F1 [Chitinophaga tropicalis]